MTNLSTDKRRINIPSDPKVSADFDGALTAVVDKYRDRIPLTRAELMALVKATLALIGGQR